MRDRLIELIVNAENEIYHKKPYFTDTERIGAVAESLLAEGVIVPPAKVGDRIYYIDSTNFIDCEVVKQISFNHHGKWLVLLDHSCISFDEIGKTVFLTRSEAEQALAERSADDDT